MERPTAEQVKEARENLEAYRLLPADYDFAEDEFNVILAELDAVTAERDAARAAKHQIVDTVNKSVAEQWAGLEAQVYGALRERDEAREAIRVLASLIKRRLPQGYRDEDGVWRDYPTTELLLPAVKAAMEVSDAN